MKALVYHGPWNVQIDDKPQPTIQHPEDAILRITSTAICGSDLHLYHGTVPRDATWANFRTRIHGNNRRDRSRST